ncbi:MAG: hypothetical protein KDD44_05250 [Bdellovibrionales bacterium]|nr:hypothetical protein [Bdellovibrionales bacterium]
MTPCRLYHYISFALLLGLVGCGIVRPPHPAEDLSTEVSAQPDLRPPVHLDVAQEFIDANNHLRLKVLVGAEAVLPSDRVIVTVRGMRNGEVEEEQSMSVAEASGRPTLGPGERVALYFNLNAVPLSEYQVECAWGLDLARSNSASRVQPGKPTPPSGVVAAAKNIGPRVEAPRSQERALASREPEIPEQPSAPSPTSTSDETRPARNQVPQKKRPDEPKGDIRSSVIQTPTVTIEKVSRSAVSCQSPPCDELMTATIVITNPPKAPVRDALELAVGLMWLEEGKQPRVNTATPQPGEDIVQLNGLRLMPGGHRRVRIRIERPVPVVVGGAFIPTVRIADRVQIPG